MTTYAGALRMTRRASWLKLFSSISIRFAVTCFTARKASRSDSFAFCSHVSVRWNKLSVQVSNFWLKTPEPNGDG